MQFYDTAVHETKRWEGVIRHMYLDIEGKVTVGVGFMIPASLAAKTYRFVVRGTGKAATDQQKEDEWKEINRQKKGLKAQVYKKYTKLDYAPDEKEINAEVLQKIIDFEKKIMQHYKDYRSYPDEVKLALLDMAYNMGIGRKGAKKGLLQFEQMKKAIETGDWNEAAAQSRRRPPTRQERNEYVRDLFLAAGRRAATEDSRRARRNPYPSMLRPSRYFPQVEP